MHAGHAQDTYNNDKKEKSSSSPPENPYSISEIKTTNESIETRNSKQQQHLKHCEWMKKKVQAWNEKWISINISFLHLAAQRHMVATCFFFLCCYPTSCLHRHTRKKIEDKMNGKEEEFEENSRICRWKFDFWEIFLNCNPNVKALEFNYSSVKAPELQKPSVMAPEPHQASVMAPEP